MTVSITDSAGFIGAHLAEQARLACRVGLMTEAALVTSFAPATLLAQIVLVDQHVRLGRP